ncbi:MAG: hypothetical protein FWD25_01895 [Clostridia bacterium]|nr:hypothetical protein [Clostridia bacterium]
MLGRRLVAMVALCTLFACTFVTAAQALDLHRNAFGAATDGEDVYFLTASQNTWSIHSARRMLAGESPVVELPEGTEPYGMLYACGEAVWYARYSQELRAELEGQTRAALEFVRYELATGQEKLLVTDADPDALFPMDGHTLSYLPWGDEHSLATADFVTQTDLLTLEVEDSLIWDAAQIDGALYLLLYNPAHDYEALYRIADDGAERLPEPEPKPGVSWLQGNYRVYATGEGDFFAAPLSAPSWGYPLPMGGEQDDVYYFGDYRWICQVEPGNVARLYRIPLAENEQIYYLEYDALPQQPFVRGAGAHEMITLDRRGRLLSIDADFSALTQVAQLEYTTLFSAVEWLWALPFPDFVLMLGYSADAHGAPQGLEYPPDTARVVRRGEGMEDGPLVFPSQTMPIPADY